VELEPCAAFCVLSLPKRARIEVGAFSRAVTEFVGPMSSRHASTAFSFWRANTTHSPDVMNSVSLLKKFLPWCSP